MEGRTTRLVFKIFRLGWFAVAFALAPNVSVFAGPADNSLVIGTSQEPRTLGGDFLGVISNQAIKTEIQHFGSPPVRCRWE